MKINYIGQSGFIIEEGGLRIGIDIWLDNPLNPTATEDIPKFDALFLTHDHADHGRADMIALAKRDNAPLVTQLDIASDISANEGLSDDLLVGANIGGEFAVGEISVLLTQAHHSSDVGVPTGVIIRFPNGNTIYHLGDTGFFSDLSFYGSLYHINVLFVPIGGFFTMDPRTASFAVEAVQPSVVIPMHYSTFEKLTQDPGEFAELIAERGAVTEMLALKPGESSEV